MYINQTYKNFITELRSMKKLYISHILYLGCALIYATLINICLYANIIDGIVNFYTSPIPNPPAVYIDMNKVLQIVETGDIIIENNMAYPQWAVMIASLVPGTKYVHAGIVVKGHVLYNVGKILQKKDPNRKLQVYRKKRLHIADNKSCNNGKSFSYIWKWLPEENIHYGRVYIVTPEVVENMNISIVSALDLEDYLKDPALGYSTKHIKIIRPNNIDQKGINNLSIYLGFHLFSRTPYDMGFDLSEEERGIRIIRNNEIEIDFQQASVPLYCTELVYRALKFINLETLPLYKNEKAAKIANSIPKFPNKLKEKLDSYYVTADSFIEVGSIIYQNDEPPSIAQIMKIAANSYLGELCKMIKIKFSEISSFTKKYTFKKAIK